MAQPEQLARETIDRLLVAAGWHVCDVVATQPAAEGSKVEAGYYVEKQERDTRKTRWEELDDDFAYAPNQLDRDVQIMKAGDLQSATRIGVPGMYIQTIKSRTYSQPQPSDTV